MAHAEAEAGVETAVKMRRGWDQAPEKLSSSLQKFFDKMFQIKIYDLEKVVADLSPTTIALFEAIKSQMETARMILVEKLTANSNVEAFTADTEDGIAANMPTETIPLVIAALAKIAIISHYAHAKYESMKSQLPAMLIQLKKALTMQAIIVHDEKTKTLEKKKTILEKLQPNVTTATANLAHDPNQQRKIKNQTSWFEVTILKIKEEIKEKKRTLQMLMSENDFFEAGASQLSAPLAT